VNGGKPGEKHQKTVTLAEYGRQSLVNQACLDSVYTVQKGPAGRK